MYKCMYCSSERYRERGRQGLEREKWDEQCSMLHDLLHTLIFCLKGCSEIRNLNLYQQ